MKTHILRDDGKTLCGVPAKSVPTVNAADALKNPDGVSCASCRRYAGAHNAAALDETSVKKLVDRLVTKRLAELADPEQLLRAREVAKMLGVKTSVVRALARKKKIASVPVAKGKTRFTRAAVRDFIASRS